MVGAAASRLTGTLNYAFNGYLAEILRAVTMSDETIKARMRKRKYRVVDRHTDEHLAFLAAGLAGEAGAGPAAVDRFLATREAVDLASSDAPLLPPATELASGLGLAEASTALRRARAALMTPAQLETRVRVLLLIVKIRWELDGSVEDEDGVSALSDVFHALLRSLSLVARGEEEADDAARSITDPALSEAVECVILSARREERGGIEAVARGTERQSAKVDSLMDSLTSNKVGRLLLDATKDLDLESIRGMMQGEGQDMGAILGAIMGGAGGGGGAGASPAAEMIGSAVQSMMGSIFGKLESGEITHEDVMSLVPVMQGVTL